MIPARRIRQDDDSRAVIPDLIRNLCYCQKTIDPDFRQDDNYGDDSRQADSSGWRQPCRHSGLDPESVLLSENADPDFRQDDAFVRACPEFNSGMTATISVPIQPPGLNSFKSSLEGVFSCPKLSGA